MFSRFCIFNNALHYKYLNVYTVFYEFLFSKQLCAANQNKPADIANILVANKSKLLRLLGDLKTDRGLIFKLSFSLFRAGLFLNYILRFLASAPIILIPDILSSMNLQWMKNLMKTRPKLCKKSLLLNTESLHELSLLDVGIMISFLPLTILLFSPFTKYIL